MTDASSQGEAWTAGPWQVSGLDVLDSEGGLVVCVTTSYERGKAARDRGKADRNLIAAAPDLYAMLDRFVAYASEDDETVLRNVRILMWDADAVLAQARGDAQ